MLPIAYGPFVKYNPRMPIQNLQPTDVSECVNTVLVDGVAKLSPGFTKLLADDLNEEIKLIQEHLNPDGTRFVCVHTKTKFYVYDPATGTLVDYSQGAGYTSSEFWSATSYGTVYVFTNGAENPQVWTAIGTLADAIDLANAPKCRIVRTFGPYLIAAAIIDVGDTKRLREIRWSASNDITNWTTLDSGFATAYEGEGPIVALEILTRDSLVIYKEKSLHTLPFVGAPYYFVVSNSISGVGARVRRAGVARIGNIHVVMSTQGLVSFDGAVFSEFQPVIKSIYDQYAMTPYIDGAIIIYDNMRRRLFIGFPEDKSYKITTMLVWEQQTDNWHVETGLSLYALGVAQLDDTTTTWDGVDASITWDAMEGIWDSGGSRPRLLLADDHYIYKEDQSYFLRDAAGYTGTVILGLRNPSAELWEAPFKMAELVQADILGVVGNPTIQVGTVDVPGGSIVYGAPLPITNGRAFTTKVGRWFTFKIIGSSNFGVSGIVAYFVPRGVY